MILPVYAKLNEIFDKGRKFNWVRPDTCPRCSSVRVWGHGYVLAYFDGFTQGVLLRRFRCPDCHCIIRMKPKGYFPRFQAAIHTIRSCLDHRLTTGRWPAMIPKSRQRHWLLALKRKVMAFFAHCTGLMAAFDRFRQMGITPVSRAM